MQLTDPAGNIMTIFANKTFNDNQGVVLSDGSINQQVSTLLTLSDYVPTEPFNKLIRDQTTSSRGNWTLKLINRLKAWNIITMYQ